MIILAWVTPAAESQLSGPLSGIIQSGEYSVTGNISVEIGDSLYIESGTTFLFEPNILFEIFGRMEAVGTEVDSIFFISGDSDTTWSGMIIRGVPLDSVIFEFCEISGTHTSGSYPDYLGGGIQMYSSDAVFRNCRIYNNWNHWGGGILCDSSSAPLITDCSIEDNYSPYFGGGIGVMNGSSPVISNCLVSGNSAGDGGGGIFCRGTSPRIENCIIRDNTSVNDGAGIFCNFNSTPVITNSEILDNIILSGGAGGGIFSLFSDPIIENCIVSGNTGATDGGGIFLWGTEISVEHCLVKNNSAMNNGGGIFMHFYNSSIVNCIITDNYAGVSGSGLFFEDVLGASLMNSVVSDNDGYGFFTDFNSEYVISYCDFFNNSSGNFSGFYDDVIYFAICCSGSVLW